MFLIDSLALAPIRAVAWIGRKVAEEADRELAARQTGITEALSRLHGQLDRGELTEAQFDERERVLLDEYDDVRRLRHGGTGD